MSACVFLINICILKIFKPQLDEPEHPPINIKKRKNESYKETTFKFLNKLKIIDISNNLGDTKSLITHPSTTTHHRLKNITIFVDKNSWQSFGRTKEILNLGNLKKKFQCFNFDTHEINGHSLPRIISSMKKKTKLPKIIICNTIKGKGVKRIEDKLSSHYYPAIKEDLK